MITDARVIEIALKYEAYPLSLEPTIRGRASILEFVRALLAEYEVQKVARQDAPPGWQLVARAYELISDGNIKFIDGDLFREFAHAQQMASRFKDVRVAPLYAAAPKAAPSAQPATAQPAGWKRYVVIENDGAWCLCSPQEVKDMTEGLDDPTLTEVWLPESLADALPEHEGW
jgi:hypothetical protein